MYNLNQVGREQDDTETRRAQTTKEGKVGKLGAEGAQKWREAGTGSGDTSVAFCILPRREYEKNPKNSLGALTAYQLSEIPPKEAYLGLPSSYLPQSLATDSGVRWQEQEVTEDRAGSSDRSGQSSLPQVELSGHLC